MKITVTCLPGLEEILAEEVSQLGGTLVEIQRRAVSCQGDLKLLYQLNLQSRFGLRVLLHLEHHKVKNEEEMYVAMRGIDWTEHFDVDHTFIIRSSFGRHNFKNTHYFSLKAKDAVVDRFKEAFDRRPSIDTKSPQIGIQLYFDAGELDIYMDSSGYSLHKRGYKRFLGQASLSETLSAAMFRWGEWKPGQTVINPMCGIGTIAIEAASSMTNSSPQAQRKNFAFRHWNDYDDDLYRSLRQEVEVISEIKVLASDKDERAVRECRENTVEAGLNNAISCEVADFFDMAPIDNALILLNPPYDMRLREEDVVAFYKDIGDTLKFKWKNCRCVIISGNLPAFKYVGLKPNKKYKVFNGPLPAEVRVFDIY